MKKLRIAQIAPLWERTPPSLYGGTEKIVSQITETLVKRGYKVTLFATGDSKTKARLKSVYPRPLYRDNIAWTNIGWPLLHYASVFDQAKSFDVIHFHYNVVDTAMALPIIAKTKTPTILTLHAVLPTNDMELGREGLKPLILYFKNLNYVSISRAQRTLPLNYLATVYNGVDLDEISFSERPKDYLVWLGRIEKIKGAAQAVEIAQKSNRKLILAGKYDQSRPEVVEYFKRYIEPKFSSRISYIGEVSLAKKARLLGGAQALLNPISWNEPFGLVPVEAMAAGTPVIATKYGAMTETIKDGKTGFLVNDIDQAVKVLGKVDSINRKDCRSHVEKHFSAERMANDYESVYQKLLK